MIVIAEARVPRNITALSNVNRRTMGYVSTLDRTEFHNLRLAHAKNRSWREADIS